MRWSRVERVLRGSRRSLMCCALLLLSAPVPLLARDAFVVISGGGDPAGNNYSQYLSARGYVTYLRGRYSPDDIWVFFGAGNVTGRPAVLRDVMQTVKGDKGHKSETWIPGDLPGNRPARRDVIERAFREEILPAVRDGGTLYLMVGDHGAPSGTAGDPDSESVITLWSVKPDPTHPYGWRHYNESLAVGELRSWLVEGLGRGRVVFVMSQCYSGGFHYLGISQHIAPRAEWFTRTPFWATSPGLKEIPPLPVAGFTATDHISIASGCTPDVDADNWAGYERYLVEQLTGLDLFNLAAAGTVRQSFHDAHVAAALVDQTVDKPRGTSEEYLRTWARLLTRVADEPADSVNEKLRPALEQFRKVMEGGAVQSRDRALLEREAAFRRFNASMLKSNSALKDLLSASRKELETVIAEDAEPFGMSAPERAPESSDDDDSPDDVSPDDVSPAILGRETVERLWQQRIEVAWGNAIRAGKAPPLPAAVLNYERMRLKLDEPPSATPRSFDFMESEAEGMNKNLFYMAGFGDPRTFDEARAREVLAWDRDRYRRIIDWAKSSEDPQVRLGASMLELEWANDRRFNPDQLDAESDESESARPDRSTAATRILSFRQVLAAWQFLLGVGDRAALARLEELARLERTALPPPNPALATPSAKAMTR